jgi:hypothetical protein
MDANRLSNWLQIVGLFGVLGGLVFVGLQLRQDQRIASAEDVFTSASLRFDLAEILGGDAEVWVKGARGESLSEVEEAQFDAMIDAAHGLGYAVWYRETQIGSPRDAQNAARATASFYARTPALLRYWYERNSDSGFPFETAVNNELERVGAVLPE